MRARREIRIKIKIKMRMQSGSDDAWQKDSALTHAVSGDYSVPHVPRRIV
jgi:hypothetical protein